MPEYRNAGEKFSPASLILLLVRRINPASLSVRYRWSRNIPVVPSSLNNCRFKRYDMINLTEIFPQTIQYTMGFDSHIVLGDPDSISNATGNKHNLIFYSSLTCYNQQYCQELQILTAEPKKGVFKKK
jgi:hypothetical protein